jgi:hypothetical protein
MPDKENLGNVRLDWYTRGEHDLRGAQILFREGGYTDTIAFLKESSKNRCQLQALIFFPIPVNQGKCICFDI